ncbi:DUF418 domain-containing protein [Altererythrobacter indicus]|uniref:DUF418 domain-containing protein n=1 Tax=Altericroceibacterium indicum TaxID=374177 RepID=A0A845AAF3_9SPHN|nr:DUF418 domain-containing protein [Altericroceibacterium indicum]MXP25785.1 DUF418 domain-containing protein [Altericroceibacterium indicum]
MSDHDDWAVEGELPEHPVERGERLVSLDLIRGISVLGILFANITAFAHPMLAYSWPGALPGGGNMADDIIWLIQFIFVDGKFRGLFSLLFGAGMMLFMERVWARGGSRWLQARRLFWLMLFGLAHFYLLFIGDILFIYAISGFFALPMLRWTAARQLWSGLIWYVLGSLALSGLLGATAALEANPTASLEQSQQLSDGWQSRVDEAAEETEVIQNGDYGDILNYRFSNQSDHLAESIFTILFETLPLMVLGMGLYRLGFFQSLSVTSRYVFWGWVGVIGGAVLNGFLGLWAMETGFAPFLTQFIFNGPSAFPRLGMILGIAALLTAWTPLIANSWLGSRCVAAGRMAFSNYIGTSLLMLLIFQGWAGGLYGQLHRLPLLPIVLLGWALMLICSKLWLDKYRYGPLEWLWRCLTYGTLFAIKR